MEKEYNKKDIDYDAIRGDFDVFLQEHDWQGCDAVIDNLVDLKEYQAALGLCMKRCAAIMKDRMTLPADYGEEENVLFAEKDNPLKDVEVIF